MVIHILDIKMMFVNCKYYLTKNIIIDLKTSIEIGKTSSFKGSAKYRANFFNRILSSQN